MTSIKQNIALGALSLAGVITAIGLATGDSSTGYTPKNLSFPPSKCLDGNGMSYSTAKHAWLCSDGFAVSSDGGISLSAGDSGQNQLVLSPNTDISYLKLEGTYVMAPLSHNPAVFATDGGSLSISMVHGGQTVNLSTDGSIDWVNTTNTVGLNFCAEQATAPQVNTKVSSNKSIRCPSVYPIMKGIARDTSVNINCNDNIAPHHDITYSPADSMGSVNTSGSHFGCTFISSNDPSDRPYGFGLDVNIPPGRSTVVKMYTGIINLASDVCTATISDGSHTPVTAGSVSSPVGVTDVYTPVVTVTSKVQSVLHLECLVVPGTHVDTAGISVWAAEVF